MIRAIRRTILPLLLTTVALSANAQFVELHGGSISVGAFGEFNTPFTTNPTSSTTFHSHRGTNRERLGPAAIHHGLGRHAHFYPDPPRSLGRRRAELRPHPLLRAIYA